MANILVVEDDVQLLDMVERMLEKGGHVVSRATNGSEAMAALAEEAPDLVLTDVYMPEKDGVELIMELARQPEPPALIAMSGGGILQDTSMLDVVGKLGAVRTLRKPFGKDELLATVDDALAG